jgi:hypothetical protein
MLIGSFPFTKIGKGYLGVIFRPLIDVLVFADKQNEWFPARMVVDSGADYTLFPKRFAEFLGIDLLNSCFAQTSTGIGGSETVYLYKKGIRIKIGDWEERIPVGFLERDDVPALLGRLKCLQKIGVSFRNHRTILER